MTSHISSKQRQFVVERANEQCEYCLLHQTDAALFDHEVDHVIAEKHGGPTTHDNLALACFECNRYKGSDVASFDPITGKITLLFNPREQHWSDHFQLNQATIVPLTPEGRVTAYLLRLNSEARLLRRSKLIALKRYPR